MLTWTLSARHLIRRGAFVAAGILSLALASTTAAQQTIDLPSPMVNFLRVNVGSAWLQPSQENLVFADNVWPPGHAAFNTSPVILPVPNPSPAVFWGVLFSPAPYTVRNTTHQPIDIFWNVYSDNSYVYQGRDTIPALSYKTLNFSTMMMGYIYGPNPPGSVGPGAVGPLDPGGHGMSLVIGIYPLQAGLIGYWDTLGPTPYLQGAGRVSGGSVTLTPLCRTATCQ
jgi:hypothetical protein